MEIQHDKPFTTSPSNKYFIVFLALYEPLSKAVKKFSVGDQIKKDEGKHKTLLQSIKLSNFF